MPHLDIFVVAAQAHDGHKRVLKLSPFVQHPGAPGFAYDQQLDRVRELPQVPFVDILSRAGIFGLRKLSPYLQHTCKARDAY